MENPDLSSTQDAKGSEKALPEAIILKELGLVEAQIDSVTRQTRMNILISGTLLGILCLAAVSLGH